MGLLVVGLSGLVPVMVLHLGYIAEGCSFKETAQQQLYRVNISILKLELMDSSNTQFKKSNYLVYVCACAYKTVSGIITNKPRIKLLYQYTYEFS